MNKLQNIVPTLYGKSTKITTLDEIKNKGEFRNKQIYNKFSNNDLNETLDIDDTNEDRKSPEIISFSQKEARETYNKNNIFIEMNTNTTNANEFDISSHSSSANKSIFKKIYLKIKRIDGVDIAIIIIFLLIIVLITYISVFK